MLPNACPKPRKSKKVPARVSLKHGKRMKQRNAKRQGHMFPKAVSQERRAFIRSLPCVLAFEPSAPGHHHSHDCTSHTRCCHLKSRGSGGKDEGNMWPGCDAAHAEQHRLGAPDFAIKWRVDLVAECARREAEYVAAVRAGGTEP